MVVRACGGGYGCVEGAEEESEGVNEEDEGGWLRIVGRCAGARTVRW